MRHAPGAAAEIRIHRKGNMLEVLALDDGGQPGDRTAVVATGRGLIGMRERVALAGGRLLEAAHSGTGFRVHALIPTGDDQARLEDRVS